MRRASSSGFSLAEILVAIAILGLLMALGMPSYMTWIQNTQIRTAAEAILAGLQTAKNEAIRRNAAIQFKLVNGTANSKWAINFFTDPDRDPPLFGREAAEGSPNATLVLTPGGADTVTFSALGRVIPNNDASASLTQVLVDNPTIAAADRRTLQILIPTGGAIRLCDPKVLAGDPRTCNP